MSSALRRSSVVSRPRRWAGRRLATGLLAVLLSPILAAMLSIMPGAQGADPPMPVVSLAVPSSPLIGQDVAFDVSFVNVSATEAGYGPFVDLSLPLGADGDDGLTFVSATYLGADVTAIPLVADLSGCVLHPYAVQASGAPVQMCGLDVGQSYVVLRLPFGSFTPGQPAATVHVVTHLSNLADAGSALTIGARGGFQFGATPLADPATDPSILGLPTTSEVTPTVIRVTKTYHGPESETATGPNFPRSYTIDVTVAAGQLVTDLTITDTLPNTIQYLSTDPPAHPFTSIVEPSTSTPGGALTINFGSVTGTGGVDATATFRFFVPRLDGAVTPAPVLPPATGAFNTSTDSVMAGGSWTPIDPRDSLTAVTAGPATHTLTDKSIAVQKSVALITDTGPAGVNPGDTLEWTIAVQVSDYFALNSVVVDDLLGDGTRFDAGFTPTLVVHGNGFDSVPVPADFDAANYTVSAVDGGTGKTPISFRLSNELITRGQDGRMVGGCIDPTTGSLPPDCFTHNDGGTTATITFRSIVQRTYVDGTTEVVEGDTLHNDAAAIGTVLKTDDFTSTGNTIGDGSAGVATAGTHASISIERGTLEKSIYAINGSTSFATPVHVAPGDTVTYRLKQSFPTSRTDDFRMIDYLPLPVFYASGVTFDAVADDTAPAAGHAKYLSTDTFHSKPAAPTPTVSTDPVANSVEFHYGDYALYPPEASSADIVFTVTVSTSPFADGLLLTNQARSETKNSAGTLQTADAIVQITLDQPVLGITKGVVGTDSASGVFTPATVGPVPFTPPAAPPSITCPGFTGGPVTTTGLTANPINSNLSGVDAGDYVRFAIVVQNTGHAAAYEVRIRDTLPAGFAVPGGGLDMCVTNGAGANIGTTNIGGGSGLFDQGIQLVDGANGALAAGLSGAGVPNATGTNLVVITYTLRVDISAVPESVITNTATLINYTNDPGASDHLAAPLTDNATVTIAPPAISKRLTGTNQAHTAGTAVAIGEIVTYEVTLTVPEGTMPGTTVVDTLPGGLAMVDCSPITASAGVSSSTVTFGNPCVAGTNPTVGTGGQIVTFDLGTVTNSNSSNGTPETIVITYRAAVLNVSGNVRGTNLSNSASLSWTGGSLGAVTAGNVTVVEPRLTVGKSASAATGDAGDTITFTISVTNSNATNGADAFNVTLTDVVPTGMTYVGGTFLQTGGTTATSTSVVGATLTATWDTLAQGNSATFQFSVTIDGTVTPGTVFHNTANAAWTSLPGDVTTAQSSFNPVSTERTGDTGNPGGSVNDYRANHSADVTVPLATVTKSVTDTNQAHTSGLSVAVGEIVTYQAVLTIPEGMEPSARLTDTLPAGLALVDCTGISASADLSTTLSGGFGDACHAGSNPTVGTGGQLVTFDLGTITNANRDNGVAETITITYRAVVLNVGTNVRGRTLHNSAVLSWTGGHSATASAQNVTVLEPIMTLTKARNPATGDAGDTITYTIAITNPSVSNNTDAFNVVWSDAIPAGLTYVPGSLQCISGTCPALNDSGAPNLSATWSTFALTGTSVLRYQATLDANVPSGGSYTNTARLTWTSLPGDVTSPQSTFNGVSTERTGSAGDPGGAVNNYVRTSRATVTVPQPAPAKSLVCTSEAGTATTHVAIGEVVRFRVAVVFPEGVTPAVSIADALPAGLRFLNDGTAKIAFVANGGGAGITSDAPGLSGPGLAVSGDGSWSGDPTFVIPPGQITGGPFVDGTDPTFSLGVLTNADRDDDAEMIVIEFNVLVDNVAGNTAGTARTDQATIDSNGTPLAAAGSATVTVAEPSITFAKTITTTPTDGGDTVVYRITITNGSGANVSPAYDIHVTDALDSTLTLVSVVTGGASGVTDDTNYVTGAVDLTFDVIAPGATETIDITATVADNVDAGKLIPNTANATWTSLPGAQGTTPNATGSSTPGLSGSDTGERNGSGGVNTYSATSGAPVTLAAPSVEKLGPANPNVPVGDTTTFDLLVTVPEGTTRSLTVADHLPAGLLPVSWEVITTQSGSGGRLSHDYAGTLSSPTVNAPAGALGGEWTFAFGDTYLAPNLVSGDGSFVIRITVRVANTTANQSGHHIDNTVGVTYTDPESGSTTIPAPLARTVIVIEPVLTVTKTVSNPTPRFNDTVTYTLTIRHSGASNSNAYDVTLTDAVPTGMTLQGGTLTNTAGLAPSTMTASGNDITITFSSFPLGSSSTFTYSAVVGDIGTVTLLQTLTNSVASTWTSTAGSNPDERTGSVSDPGGSLNDYRATTSVNVVVSGIDMTISKTDGQTTATAGAVRTYTITYHNVGNQSATGVVITETVPIGTTYTGSGWTCPGGTGAGNTCTRTIGTVAAGATSSVTFAVTVVDPIPSGLTQISNTATIADDHTKNVDPTPANNTTTDVDTIAQVDLSLTKSVVPSTPDAGQVVVFTITVSNRSGLAAATGVRVTDILPAGLTYVSSSASTGSYSSVTGVWTVGTVNSGASQTLTLRATVASAGSKTNVAEVTHCDQSDTDSTPGNGPGEDDYATATVDPNVADLGVAKSADPIHPDVGSDVTFTIVATNHGPNDATGVTVTDMLPTGLTYKSSSATSGSYASGTGVWTIGSLANGSSATLTLVATVTLAGEIQNTATITGGPFDPNPSNNTAHSTTSQLVNLVVTKEVDDAATNVGQTATFTVKVRNDGPGAATNVVILDLLPAGLTYVAAETSQGTYNPANGHWDVGTIAVSGEATLTLHATVVSSSAVTNTASVLSLDEPQSSTADDSDSATVTPPHADMQVTKTVDQQRPNKGDKDTFTITVRNNGPDKATGVVVTDLLPAGLDYDSPVSSSASQGSFDTGTGKWTVGDLESGESATLTLYIVVTDAGDYTNTATVSADQYDPTPGNNTDSASLSTREADIEVLKEASNSAPHVGTTVTFKVTVTNGGPDGATQLVVHDTLPAGLTFISATPNAGTTYDPATGDWAIGDLDLGASATLTITARVVGSGSISNTASVTGLLQRDPEPDNDSDTATLDVPPAADLSLTKTVDVGTPDKGSNVTFTITVTNHGPNGTSGVHVSDLLPAGLTWVSDTPSVGTYNHASGDWDIGAMANGDSVTLTIVATVDIEGPITNTAQVSASDLPDPNSTPGNSDPTEDDQASAHINSRGVADLAVVKTAAPATLHRGDQAIYTIVVTNNGPDGATGVIVRDQLPAGVTYVSSSGGTYNSTTGAWTVGSLASGSSATLTITVRVGQTGSIHNVAEVAASDQRDPDPDNNADSADITAAGATAPPTVTASAALPAGEPGSLLPWLLDLALAALALMASAAMSARNRRLRYRFRAAPAESPDGSRRIPRPRRPGP